MSQLPAKLTPGEVESWTSNQLHSWLVSIQPPPFGSRAQTEQHFLAADVDGAVFLASSEQWFVDVCKTPSGVARKLWMLGQAIREGSKRQREASTSSGSLEEVEVPAKRARLNDPAHSAGDEGIRMEIQAMDNAIQSLVGMYKYALRSLVNFLI